MRIGFIGAGHIGGTLARLVANSGHEVGLSNTRDPATLAEMACQLGPKVHAATPVEIAGFAQLLVVAIPFGQYHRVPAAEAAGKVVVDANNYYFKRDGRFEELDDERTTSSELLQEHLAGARVVKAFNTMNWRLLQDLPRPAGAPDRVGVPIAGDDAQAKKLVGDLIYAIGFDPVDIGPLSAGRRLQPGSAVFGKALTAEDLRGALGVRAAAD